MLYKMSLSKMAIYVKLCVSCLCLNVCSRRYVIKVVTCEVLTQTHAYMHACMDMQHTHIHTYHYFSFPRNYVLWHLCVYYPYIIVMVTITYSSQSWKVTYSPCFLHFIVKVNPCSF